MGLEINIENRDELIDKIKQELIGPVKVDKDKMFPLKVTQNVVFQNREETYRKYYNSQTLEEILQVNPPLLQYSAGVLFPFETESDEVLTQEKDLTESNDEGEEKFITKDGIKNIETLIERSSSLNFNNKEVDEVENVDLMPQKNDFSPASLALSYYVRLENENSKMNIEINGGSYKNFSISLADEKKLNKWWTRETVNLDLIQFSKKDLIEKSTHTKNISVNGLTLQLLLFSRNYGDNKFLITISLTNRTPVTSDTTLEECCLFQSEISLTLSDYIQNQFCPYPSTKASTQLDEEENSNRLLYREAQTFALGHGCSANWFKDKDRRYIERISSTFLPEYEAISMTPDITDQNGNTYSISMLELAELVPNSDAIEEILSNLVETYEKWIDIKEKEVASLQAEYGNTPKNHLDKCRESAQRMKSGIELLKKDENVRKAFKLANYAMAIQQVVGTNIRDGEVKDNNIFFEQDIEFREIPKYNDILERNRGNWRAFQIAFFLMSIPSVAEGNSIDREVVDLIWFPTGGGKTEAYLGVAAFSMFLKRLKDNNDTGTDIIMRYTLRLLTTDQFQRSSRLICAMEMLRKKFSEDLGGTPFSIGIWLGSKVTPNQNEGSYGAKEQLKQWKEGNDRKSFIVKSCPWCGAKLGKYTVEDENVSTGLASRRKKTMKKEERVLGYDYSRKNKELIINCPDKKCPFHNKIDVYIVDESIYEHQPTFIIGTIDKFAMLSWKPEARALFGIDRNGKRHYSPPNLIIQDELHLISGPLGSMTGMYEILIEELSTDRRTENPIKPKIICSTATIRRYEEQIMALYGRDKNKAKLFPSPGLSHDDSFFAKVAVEENNLPAKGRKYVGVYSPVIGMQMLQVKIYSILLQSVMNFQEDNRDPFWTLLSFFNSLRELGGALTLLQTDIPSYLNQVRKKHNITDRNQTRWLNNFLELTSRLDSGEVSDVIHKLKDNKNSIDVCLASNIIEVGVDIDRLSLMTVVGQPKNTAQYIQVTGRVGRNWKERPGLVVTLYKTGISRDKSHYEHFREYHERLYSKVEPTSVTPYSDPCINRSLYGLIIGYLRQLHDEKVADSPEYVREHINSLNNFKALLLNRVKLIDPKQTPVVEKNFDLYVNHILNLGATSWEEKSDGGYFLMYQSGSYVQERYKSTALPVPMSMRNVDASCQGEVTNSYLVKELEEMLV
ncbi:helicase-related protein [Alkalihalophilus pseudofirmus]|uniref:helicase-related protein n=1 Tax=Alkalihalophilus pseudofirmus TaxID=79885 RepID=UPI00259B0557|nr:helicase-related protein [Alkalihalophilus pseudofirmus]WEG18936.1 helicase-related protein [Alkalihalophilus pseudofirmus]